MERMMPPQAEKANLNKTPFEKIEEEKGIKDFLTTSFNDKTIISNINSGDVLVFDNNEGKNRELLDQYGQAMNLSYQGDINDQNYLFDLENQLYLRAHPININDFKHVKNVSIEDIQLFKKVFGSKKFNFDLNTIGTNLDEVLIFLRYTKNANEKDFERILKYKKEYGVSTFLSLIHGGKEMGDKILILGEKLPKDSAEVLFAKYAELVDIANNVSVELKNTIGKDAPANFEESVREHLLIKGKDMLNEYAGQAEGCEGQTCIDLAHELNEKLKHAKGSMILFASVCRNLVEIGEFDFNDFKDVELVQGTEFNEREEELMRFMALENTKQYPDKLRDYWYGTLDSAIKNKDPKETFVAVKYKGEIAGFMRVKELDENTLYGASFNINPNLRGSRIGTELLKKVIENYTQTKDFTAHVYEKNPMIEVYTNKFGFEIVGEEEDYHDTGAKVLQIKKSRKI